MYRLIAIDLDGTLLTPQKMITPRAHQLLCQIATLGVTIVIATGQSLPVIRQVCAGLPLTAPQISENGAVIVDVETGNILHKLLVPDELILPTHHKPNTPNTYRAYHTLDRVFVDNETPRARNWYRPPVPPVIEIEDVATIYPRPCIKLAAVGDRGTLREKRRLLEEILAGKLYVTQSAYDLLEMLHPEVSKGQALRFLANELAIQPEEIVAIGDNHNDIGMLHFAGFSVAMGNAHEEVKAAARHVTLSNAEDGVAIVLEEIILPRLKGEV